LCAEKHINKGKSTLGFLNPLLYKAGGSSAFHGDDMKFTAFLIDFVHGFYRHHIWMQRRLLMCDRIYCVFRVVVFLLVQKIDIGMDSEQRPRLLRHQRLRPHDRLGLTELRWIVEIRLNKLAPLV
jgi:hypothetical protein